MSGVTRFGRYRVTGTLGAGAMGEVHAAVDDVLGREVAIKTLKGHANGLAARMLDERFRQEARAIAALAHPGVVQVFDLDLEADPPYLVMERVAGPSLKDRLAQGPLPVHEVRALGIQIARALAAAHAQRIVHRDVKPANILAAGEGRWKLADFGVAHVPDSSLTMTGQFVGSPAYAPPEALVRGQSDAEGDIYGLGATLYQATAGTWPRLDATSGALLAPVPPIRSLVPSVPDEVADIIDRAVAIEPTQRPSAADLADALAGAGSHPGARAASAPIAPAELASAPPSSAAIASAPIAAAAIAADTFATGATHAAAQVALPPPPRAPVRWQPWAAGAGALLVIALVASRCGSGAPGGAPVSTPSASPVTPAEPVPPGGLIRIETPPMRDGKAAKDWNKILDQIERGNYSGAKRKLWEWERKHAGGSTAETEALRAQLDALGADRDE